MYSACHRERSAAISYIIRSGIEKIIEWLSSYWLTGDCRILLREKKKNNRRYVMACVLGHTRLNPQAVRDHLPPEDNWKRLSFANAQEITAITGYVQGAVAPLGLPQNIPIIFDEAIARCENVNISSGDPMAGLELKPEDLIRLTGAELAPIADDR